MPENTDELTVTEITSIKVGAAYDKNVNKALFDNISLTQSSALKINYDETGNITSVTANNQPSYEYTYDENDNLTKTIDAEGVLVEEYEYDTDGNLTTVKDKDGNTTSSYLYSNDRLTRQTTDGVTTNYTYSSIGEVSGTSVSATIDGTLLTLSNSAEYNSITKALISQTDSRGKTTSYGYDTNLWLNLIEDANGVQTRYEYNADGSVAKQYVDSDKDSSLDEGEGNVQYTYDTFGRVNGVNANGMVYAFTYNNASLPEAVYISSVSDSNLLVRYTYDASYTNIISVQYGNGFTVGYTYDNLDNLTAISYNGIEKFTYEYDGNGIAIKETDNVNSITIKHLYDASGAYLGSRTISDAYTLEKYSDYDAETEEASTIYSINGTDFTYSSVFDETLDKNLYSLPTGAYSYTKDADAFGRDSGNVLKNSEGEDIISYDYIYTTDTEAGTTTDFIVGWIPTAGEDVNNFSYYYDDVGNISSIDLNGGLYVRYTYDERGQLLREDNVPKYRSYVYEYDNNGNILSKKTYYLSTGMLTALPLSTETYTYGNSVWKDQLTSSSATGSITYDSVGNPTNWRGMSNIIWNGRELTSFVKGNKTATYNYNAEGIRTRYTYNGETVDYILDGTTILGEIRTDSDNVKSYIYYYYDENGEVTGLNYLGNDYYYIKNLQGDVMYITDDTGEIVVTYYYDAWGTILRISDISDDYIGDINPFTYRSYYYDFETGLYYLQSRYYDSQTGRFLNADDTNYLGASGTTLGYNMYTYCENNPVKFIDPNGTTLFVGGRNTVKIKVLLKRISSYIVNIDDYGRVTLGKKLSTRSYPIGDLLLKQIISSAYTIRINSSNETYYSPQNMINATISLPKPFVKGSGSGGTVYLNLYGATPRSPLYIQLAHELIHALRGAKGISLWPNVSGLRSSWYRCSYEEVYTIGLQQDALYGFYKTMHSLTYYSITENSIRQEQALPLRSFYVNW